MAYFYDSQNILKIYPRYFVVYYNHGQNIPWVTFSGEYILEVTSAPNRTLGNVWRVGPGLPVTLAENILLLYLRGPNVAESG